MVIAVIVAAASALMVGGVLAALLVTRGRIARLSRVLADGNKSLSIHQARQQIITSRSGMCAFELDVVARTAAWSPEMAQLHGLADGAFDGTIAGMLALAVGADDVSAIEHGIAQLVLRGEGAFTYRVLGADGDERWIDAWAREVVLSGESHSRIVGVASDVTERKRAEAELHHVARHDRLTALPNRTELVERLARALDEPGRGALLLLDLDGFKEINDALGHGIGDLVLVEIAQRLRSCVREDDLVARLGGDEFAIVLRDLADPAIATSSAERILRTLADPLQVSPMALHVSGSIGMAVWPEHGIAPGTLLQHADVAMYRAKARGNCALMYEPMHEDDRASRLALVAELRDAIADGVLDVHYQPIVELPHDRVVGVEALARWRRPQGDVPPTVFVALAEQFGLIHELTTVVLRKALGEARRWQEDGRALRVSVNMSPRVLSNPNFAEDVKYALLAADLHPTQLILEITETALAEPTRELLVSLQELRSMGVSIALDDFGAGYSSLATLTELPVDILKIDRSFLSRLPAPNAIGVVRAIIEMARHLGIDTVAEGVEGESSAALLRELGCGFAQGYHFGRPAPVVDIRSFLDTRS